MNQESQQEVASPSNSRININTEALRQNRQTYMALGDLYQIEIFSDNTYLITEELKVQKEAKESRLEEQIFVEPMVKTEVSHPEELLFTSLSTTQKKQDYSTEKQENNSFWIAGMGVLVIVFILLMIQMQKKRKKRREEYVNHIDF